MVPRMLRFPPVPRRLVPLVPSRLVRVGTGRPGFHRFLVCLVPSGPVLVGQWCFGCRGSASSSTVELGSHRVLGSVRLFHQSYSMSVFGSCVFVLLPVYIYRYSRPVFHRSQDSSVTGL